ncbi:DNA helicase Pif1-like, partial [Trinorchestia longiramus]
IPVPVLDTSLSRIRIPSEDSAKLLSAVLILIDEASMLTTNILRIIDTFLKKVMQSNKLFGGKLLLLGGDFRQTAPVIPRASPTATVENCIKSSEQRQHVIILSHTENMRMTEEDEFNRWL